MILADRLNRIIEDRQISKAEFARRIGVTPQYVLLLTGNAKVPATIGCIREAS